MYRAWVLAAGLSVCAHGANAAIAEVVINPNIIYTQSSGAAPTVPSSYFGFVGFESQNFSEFTAGGVTLPDGSNQSLTKEPSDSIFSDFFYFTPSAATAGEFRNLLPFGSYTINATGPGGAADSVVVTYGNDFFGGSVPALTGSSYNALQGYDPSSALTLTFSDHIKNPGSAAAFNFFDIFDSSGASVFSVGFLSFDVNTITIPGGLLAASTAYTFQLVFDDRTRTSLPGGNAVLDLFWDSRTSGSFRTGDVASPVPVPGAAFLFAPALGIIAFRSRQRNRHTS